jgi:hypothetical protein
VLVAGIEPELVTRQLQAADALRATLGLDVAAWTMTDKPVGAELALSSSGASWGTLSNPETLVDAARKLVDQAGWTALALVCRLPDGGDGSAGLEAYRHGAGVDEAGGVEALVSQRIAMRLAFCVFRGAWLHLLFNDLNVQAHRDRPCPGVDQYHGSRRQWVHVSSIARRLGLLAMTATASCPPSCGGLGTS